MNIQKFDPTDIL